MNFRRLHPGFIAALWLLPVLTILQCSMVGHFSVRGIAPGIVLITVVNWGILRGMDEGMLWAFIGGVCLDVFSGWPIGTNTVALVIVASVVSLGEGTFMRTHALLPLATVFGATILYYLLVFFLLASTQHSVDWIRALRSLIIPVGIYNAALNIPAFRLVQRFERKIYPMPRANW